MSSAAETIAQTTVRFAPSMAAHLEEVGVQGFLETRIDALPLDSLDSLELIMDIEDQLGISLPEDGVLACSTIGELTELAEKARHLA